jgi:ComEC/Rec2-related protein
MKPTLILANYQQTLVPALLLFMAGALMAAGVDLPSWFWWGWLVVGAFSFGVCFLAASGTGYLRWYLWLISFFLGGTYYILFHFEPGPQDIAMWADKPQAQVYGTVIGLGSQAKQWVVSVNRLDSRKVEGRVLVKVKSPADSGKSLEIGHQVRLEGWLSRPGSARFPGDFDYQRYLKQQKITALLYANQINVVQETTHSSWLTLLKWTDQYRQKLITHFRNHLPQAEADILTGIVLGEHAVGLDYDLKMQFIRSGLIHLLAASGLNVGLIGVFFLMMGKVLRLPLRASLLIAMMGVGVYCLLTGLPPSVQRAGLMLELALMLKFFRRELTPVSLLCLTGVILVLINPMVISMVGFQLSFISTFGLLVMVKPLQERLGFYITQWGAGLVLVPTVAQLWVTPVLLFNFHQIQVVSLPANLIALPLAGILTYSGFILGGLSLIIPNITGWLLERVEIFCTLFMRVARFFGDLPFSMMHVPSPPMATIVLMMGFLMLLAYWLNSPQQVAHKMALRVMVLALVVVILPFSLARWQAHQQFRIAWIPGKYGASMQVIRAPDDVVIVNANQLNVYMARDLQNYMKKHGLTAINLLNFTEPRAKRFEGIPVLSKVVPVYQVTSTPLVSAKAQDALLDMVAEAGIPIQLLSATHLVKGRDFHSTYFTLYPQGTLQRLDLPNTCLAFYWGRNLYVQERALSQITHQCHVTSGESGGTAIQFREFKVPSAGYGQFNIQANKLLVYRDSLGKQR